MFSGGTFAWMLWTDANTKPPPGARSPIRRRASASHLSRRAPAQHPLRVDRAAPEDEVRTEVALERGRLHAHRGHLDRVQDVHADLDEVRDQLPDRTAGVEEHLRLRARWRNANSSRWSGLTSARYVSGENRGG